MRSSRLLAVLLLAACALPLRAQDDGGQGPGDQPPPALQGGGDGGQEHEATGAMSVDDARVNMQTLLQSFLAARAVDGYWPLKNKLHGGLLKLVPASKSLTGVEAVTDSRFRGTLLFMDLATKKYYAGRFEVDFGGAEWAVVGMTLKPAAAPKAAGRKRRG